MKTTAIEKQNGCLPFTVRRNHPFGRANWSFLLAGAIGFLAAASSHAQQVVFPLPFYEPFPSAIATVGTSPNGYAYENNEELGMPVSEAIGGYPACSSNVWDIAANSISSSCGRILETAGATKGLEYPGLTNVDNPWQTGTYETYTGDSASTKDRGVALAIPANNTNAPEAVYLSFLYNIQSTTYPSSTVPYPIIGLCPLAGGAGGVVVNVNKSFQLQLSKGGTTATNTTATLANNTTYLIVLSYQYNTNGVGNDSVNLWVDPVNLGASTPPPPTLSITNGANVTSNYYGGLEIFEAPVPVIHYIDEIRAGTNWAQVTPTFPAPGGIYGVSGGGTNCEGEAGQNFPTVGLSNSDVGVTYFLYTNGIQSSESVNGTGAPVSFGQQTSAGATIYSVLGSNNVSSNVGWMSGTVQGAVLTAASITSEPVPAVAVSGGLAAFSAATPNLNPVYQWYRHGTNIVNGGNISGAQSATLLINPVGAGDAQTTANGYYVEIISGCGTPAFSTTNSLTLDTPQTKYWIGDGISNLWDMGVSTNWATTSGGTPNQVFNYGDIAVFDDNSANIDVTNNTLELSASSITINGGANSYVFEGPGAFVGNGSITMNSTATLTLDTPNSMTGGLVISNGFVTWFQSVDLGPGAITLAGGELSSPNNGAEVVTNQIVVNGAGSSIGINGPGGQNLYLTGPLIGTSGTLTFVNNSGKASTPLIYVAYPNVTFNLPVDISDGTLAGNGLIVQDTNTTGTHTWGGVITDAGQMEIDGTGGTTVLTSSNTLTGSVLLYSGSLAVGSSSVLNTPGSTPPVLFGPLGTGTLDIETTGLTPTLLASAGPQTVGNLIAYSADAVGPALVIGGTNNLTLAGEFDLVGTNRTLDITDTGFVSLTGVIVDSTDDALISGGTAVGVAALTKNGSGTLYMDCFETNGVLDASGTGYPVNYGTISNTAGTIAGSGIIGGPVVVAAAGTIGAGDLAQIGTLTISNNLTLQGTASFRINKNGAVRTSDLIAGVSNVVYGGTLVLTNTGPTALAVNDTFQLFKASTSSGNFTSITGGGADFTFSPSTGVLTVSALIPVTPTNITAVVSGTSSMTLSWPASYVGWVLQTNSINITNQNDWFTYPGSGSVTSEIIAIAKTNDVYFRLVGP